MIQGTANMPATPGSRTRSTLLVGTSLLALMAKRVDDGRRAAAATLMWVLMIAGFAVTSITAGHFLDPFSPQRLIIVTACAAGIALLVAALAIWGIEGAPRRRT